METKMSISIFHLAGIVALLIITRHAYQTSMNRIDSIYGIACPLVASGPVGVGNDARMVFFNPSNKTISRIRVWMKTRNGYDIISINGSLEPWKIRTIKLPKPDYSAYEKIRFCCGRCHNINIDSYPQANCTTQFCISDEAEKRMDYFLCGRIRDWDVFYLCLARAVPDPEICDPIRDKRLKEECKWSAAQNLAAISPSQHNG